MDRAVDERGLRELVERSDDLHADAMRRSRQDLLEYTEAARTARAQRFAVMGLTIAGAAASAVFGTARSAFAADTDVQVLQTAAALENLAVGTYKTALTLPFIGGSSANAVVKAFAEKTMVQHSDHAKSFNASVKAQLGEASNLLTQDVQRTGRIFPHTGDGRGDQSRSSPRVLIEEAVAHHTSISLHRTISRHRYCRAHAGES